MATDFTEENAADAVTESFADSPDERLRTVLTSLVRHLHGFVRDVEPTIAEWEQAIGFLTATGQKCSDVRQEFILLSDVLGVSMLVETINERGAAGATQSTVLGPFHVVESPVRALGDTIDLVGDGEPCVVTGRVVSVDGTPLPGAVLDVWQADGCSPPTARAGSGSARSCPATIRSPPTARSAACCSLPAGIRTGRRTFTSSRPRTGTAR